MFANVGIKTVKHVDKCRYYVDQFYPVSWSQVLLLDVHLGPDADVGHVLPVLEYLHHLLPPVGHREADAVIFRNSANLQNIAKSIILANLGPTNLWVNGTFLAVNFCDQHFQS